MCMCHCKGKVVNDLPILGLLGDKKSSSGNVCPYISFSHVLGCDSERWTTSYGEMSEGHDHI